MGGSEGSQDMEALLGPGAAPPDPAVSTRPKRVGALAVLLVAAALLLAGGTVGALAGLRSAPPVRVRPAAALSRLYAGGGGFRGVHRDSCPENTC